MGAEALRLYHIIKKIAASAAKNLPFYSANMMALRKKRAVGLSPTALSDYAHLTIQNNY